MIKRCVIVNTQPVPRELGKDRGDGHIQEVLVLDVLDLLCVHTIISVEIKSVREGFISSI